MCPRKAIEMHGDAQGLLYPVVDKERCVDCGLCEKVCAFNGAATVTDEREMPMVYAARHRSREEVMRSRSGAVFVAVSDRILAEGGVVYGAAMDGIERVAHLRATNAAERDLMRGSKYVQSDMRGVLAQVCDDLKSGLHVLFSGTPCQTAGLQALLKTKRIDTSRLTVMDIVCHGVPAPNLWRDYIRYVGKRHGEVRSVNFRDKDKYGWETHKESFTLADGRVIYDQFLFYNPQFIRESCAHCPHACTQRPSDITIGDCWGWERVAPDMNTDGKGVSLVLVNTPKGAEIFDEIRDELVVRQIADIQNVLQPNLQHPTPRHPQRERFSADYAERGFEHACRRQGLLGWRADMRQIVHKLRVAMRVIFKI